MSEQPATGPGPAPRPGRWSLRRRLRASLALVAVLLVVVLAVTAVLLSQVRAKQDRVLGEDFSAIALSDRLYVQLVQAESGVRGYLLTGEPRLLDALDRTSSPRNSRDTATLRRLIAGDDRVVAALHRAQVAAGAWYQGWALPTVAKVRAGGQSAVTPDDVARGDRLFGTVRTDYGRYQTALLDSRSAARRSLQLRTSLLEAVVGIVAAGVVLLGAALWLALRRWVLRPLQDVAAETRSVRSGGVHHAVRFAGPAEFEALAQDVEQMRQRLESELAEGQAARLQAEEAQQALAEQAEELQRSNRDLEQFAYVASHDLQEPLRKVASFCQLLERRYAGQLDERADQYIGFAVDGAKRMQQLINDLLAFSRVGRLSEGFAEVDLEACYQQALDNLALAREDTDADVSADPLPTVSGESGLLVQLFQNLIGNALKFRGSEPPRVRIGVRRDGDEWEFSCSDNGIGIEPRYAERIFVIFQRLHPKDEYAGTGIGLAMCKKIVEYHGGRIWLDTGTEPGTTFRWTIPVAEPAPPDESAEEAGPATEPGPESATDPVGDTASEPATESDRPDEVVSV